jgi:hypothetical protein
MGKRLFIFITPDGSRAKGCAGADLRGGSRSGSVTAPQARAAGNGRSLLAPYGNIGRTVATGSPPKPEPTEPLPVQHAQSAVPVCLRGLTRDRLRGT